MTFAGNEPPAAEASGRWGCLFDPPLTWKSAACHATPPPDRPAPGHCTVPPAPRPPALLPATLTVPFSLPSSEPALSSAAQRPSRAAAPAPAGPTPAHPPPSLSPSAPLSHSAVCRLEQFLSSAAAPAAPPRGERLSAAHSSYPDLCRWAAGTVLDHGRPAPLTTSPSGPPPPPPPRPSPSNVACRPSTSSYAPRLLQGTAATSHWQDNRVGAGWLEAALGAMDRSAPKAPRSPASADLALLTRHLHQPPGALQAGPPATEDAGHWAAMPDVPFSSTHFTGGPPPCPVHGPEAPQPPAGQGPGPPEAPAGTPSHPPASPHAESLHQESMSVLFRHLERMRADMFAASLEAVEAKTAQLGQDRDLEALRQQLRDAADRAAQGEADRRALEAVLAEREEELRRLRADNEALLADVRQAAGARQEWQAQYAALEADWEAQRQALLDLERALADREAAARREAARAERGGAEQEALIRRNVEQQRTHEAELARIRAEAEAEVLRLRDVLRAQELVVEQQAQALHGLQEGLHIRVAHAAEADGEGSHRLTVVERELAEVREAAEVQQSQHAARQAALQREAQHAALLLQTRTAELDALKQSHADVVQRNFTLERVIAGLQEERALQLGSHDEQQRRQDGDLANVQAQLEAAEAEAREAKYWAETERAEKEAMRRQFVDRLTEREVEVRGLRERCAELQLLVSPTADLQRQKATQNRAHLTELAECLAELTRVRRIVDSTAKQEPDMGLLLGTGEDDEAPLALPASTAEGLTALRHDLLLLRSALAKQCAELVAHNGCVLQ
eukprot:EG_transcript_2184